MKPAWIPLLLLLLGLAACVPSPAALLPAGADLPAQGPGALAYPNPGAMPLQSTETPGANSVSAPPPAMETAIDLARRDLASRLQIDSSQIGLVNTMEITWADILAGCTSAAPQVLTQGRVHGYRVTLDAGGAVYVYHVGEAGQVIFCTQPAPGANNPLFGGSNGPTQDPYNNAP